MPEPTNPHRSPTPWWNTPGASRAAFWGMTAVITILVFLGARRSWAGGASGPLPDTTRFRDFYEFFCGAEALVKHEDPFAAGVLGYVYPPLLATLIMPLTHLGIGTASIIWLVFCGVVCWFATRASGVCGARSQGMADPSRAGLVVGVIALVLMLDKSLSEFKMQQSNTLLLAGWALGLLWLSKRPTWAGAALGFAANIKYVHVLAVPYALIRGRWRLAIATALGSVVWALLPALVLGWSRNLELLRGALGGLTGAGSSGAQVAGMARIVKFKDFGGVSITAWALSTTGGGMAGWALALGAGLLVLGAAWLVYWSRGVPMWKGRFGAAEDAPQRAPIVAMEWAGLVVASLAFSPQTNPRHLIQAILVIAPIVAAMMNSRWGRNWFLGAAGILVILAGFTLPIDNDPNHPLSGPWQRAAGPSWCLIAGWLMGLGCCLRVASGIPSFTADRAPTKQSGAGP